MRSNPRVFLHTQQVWISSDSYCWYVMRVQTLLLCVFTCIHAVPVTTLAFFLSTTGIFFGELLFEDIKQTAVLTVNPNQREFPQSCFQQLKAKVQNLQPHQAMKCYLVALWNVRLAYLSSLIPGYWVSGNSLAKNKCFSGMPTHQFLTTTGEPLILRYVNFNTKQFHNILNNNCNNRKLSRPTLQYSLIGSFLRNATSRTWLLPKLIVNLLSLNRPSF